MCLNAQSYILKKVSNKRLLLLFEQWNVREFLYLFHFFPHPVLSVILLKTARLKSFIRLTDLIPPWWWHFPIYIIFLILVIMFYSIRLCLSNSGDDIRLCRKMCFRSDNVSLMIISVTGMLFERAFLNQVKTASSRSL